MPSNFQFEKMFLDSLVGGLSALEIPRLKIQSLEQAKAFIGSYGYDLNNEDDLKKLWSYHRRSVTYIQMELLEENESIPEALSDPNQLKDLCYLLIYASTKDKSENSLQKWSCAILKVIHVLVHLENDLFAQFSKEIQDQIIKPIQSHVYSDSVSGTFLGTSGGNYEKIPLKKFEVKPFKSSDSSVSKLLAKREAVAFRILDKMGVRFITKHIFDSFRILRYLVQNNLISFPHNISDQSNNTLYPSNIFLEVVEGLVEGKDYQTEEIDQALEGRLAANSNRAEYRRKENTFSSNDYKFIKFITRRLIKIDLSEGKPLTFFYPYEIQIMDYKTYLSNMRGQASHEEYKVRQKQQARRRVLGVKNRLTQQ